MYLLIFFILFITPFFCLEQDNFDYNSNGMVVANIKKRDVIPLQPNGRRFLIGNNVSYRKTKDIREDAFDRHFEITQAQLREAQRDEAFRNSPINEVVEDSLQLRGNQMRSGMLPNVMRNGDMRENKMYEFSNLNYNPNPSYQERNHQDPRNEITGGQLRTTNRETIEDKIRYMEQVRYNNYMRNAELRDKNLDLNNNLRSSGYNDKDRQEALHDMNWLPLDDHNRL